MAGVTAFVIAILVALYLLAGVWLAGRRARKYRRAAHTEETRSAWAEARARLVELVRDGKLDPRSRTFETLFRVQTFVLRRPEAYDEIAAQLRNSILAPKKEQKPSWFEEQGSWPKELNEVFARMVQGTSLLILGYPGWGRVFQAARLIGRVLMPAVARTIRHHLLELIKKLGARWRTLQVEGDLIDACAEMKTLAEEPLDSGAWRRLPQPA